jgi:signal transduction histidine kinase
MQTNLLIHNLFYLAGAIINAGVAVLVLVNKRKEISSVVVTFVLMSLAVVIFQVSHLIGTNMYSSEASRSALMWNLTDIFIAIFMTHWFLALIGKVKEKRVALGIIYIVGIAMFVYFVMHPSDFLLNSVPKMYFPFYYNPGPLYFLMPLYFLGVGIYYFCQLLWAYKAEVDPVQKNRFRYVLLSIIYAFAVGTTAFLLVFNIPFDPLWSSFFGLYTIPLAYAMVRYELLDIQIISKRAFVYAITMTAVGIGIGFINFIGTYINQINPNLPSWIMSVLLAALISESGIYVWRKAREEDVIKYEFVNVVTHRFRGPLVDIRWATDLLNEEKDKLPDGSKLALAAIEQAENKLTELTNILVTMGNTETKKSIYHFSNFNLGDIAKSLATEYRDKFLKKNVTLDISDAPDTKVYADQEKIKFVADILINNAFHYTPEGGSVKVWFDVLGSNLEMHIKDSGIGIDKSEAPFMFTKFYRAGNARNMDVEGTGIGLYLADEIMRRSGGKISFYSKGLDLGTTFTISLPRRV